MTDQRHIVVPIMAASMKINGYVQVADKLEQLYSDYTKLAEFRNNVLKAHGYEPKDLDDVE